MTQLLIIDNYDSFTYNIVHYCKDIGYVPYVVRNDKISVEEILDAGYKKIIISPGPSTPNESGVSLELIHEILKQKLLSIDILGICLGHQALAQACGSKIIRAHLPVHGKINEIQHYNNSALFQNIPTRFNVTRYHSLKIQNDTLGKDWNIIADFTSPEGENIIMGIAHTIYPFYGVQFHPESIASEHGHTLLSNFMKL